MLHQDNNINHIWRTCIVLILIYYYYHHRKLDNRVGIRTYIVRMYTARVCACDGLSLPPTVNQIITIAFVFRFRFYRKWILYYYYYYASYTYVIVITIICTLLSRSRAGTL